MGKSFRGKKSWKRIREQKFSGAKNSGKMWEKKIREKIGGKKFKKINVGKNLGKKIVKKREKNGNKFSGKKISGKKISEKESQE